MERQWSTAQLAIALEQGQVLLIDVRPSEDTAAGHIPGSWLAPMPSLAARTRDLDDPLAERLHRAGSPVAVVAGDTKRLAAATAVLDEIGVTTVRLVGEVSAWSREGRPLNRGQHHDGAPGPRANLR